jgi:hypothetical protein
MFRCHSFLSFLYGFPFEKQLEIQYCPELLLYYSLTGREVLAWETSKVVKKEVVCVTDTSSSSKYSSTASFKFATASSTVFP